MHATSHKAKVSAVAALTAFGGDFMANGFAVDASLGALDSDGAGVTGQPAYTINGNAVSKSITRQVFGSPVRACTPACHETEHW